MNVRMKYREQSRRGFTPHHFLSGSHGLSLEPIKKSGAGFTLIEGIIAIAIISTALIVGLSLAYSNLTAAQNNSDRIIAANLAREGLEVMRNIRDSNWLRREANFDKDATTPSKIDFYTWDDFFDGWPNYTSSSVCSLLTTKTCTSDADCVSGQGVCVRHDGNYFDIQLKSTSFPTNNGHFYELVKVADSEPIKDIFSCLSGTQLACRVRKNNNGVYYQNENGSGEETPFYRRIGLKPICYNSSTLKLLVDDDQNMNCGSENSVEKGDKVGVLVTSYVVWRRGSKLLEVELKERLYNWQNL